MKAFILFITFGLLGALSSGQPGKLTVTWLDLPVHGLAAVVETPADRVFLVDTGGTRATPEYNAGRDTISPFLKSRGHSEFDGIVISHPHGDHYGGAEWLLNSNSVVLRVQHGKNVFIFPGDAYGGTFERHLKTLPPDKLKATVLTSPHHGFNPGTDFPKMAMPKYVVASCLADYPGNANTPNPRSPGDKAITVFGALGAEVFVTAFHGNITAVSAGESVTMTRAHERAPQSATPGP